MKLYGKRSLVISCVLLILLVSACGSANTGSSSPTTTSSPGKGCTKVGVSLPETASSPRWDGYDRPLLQKDIPALLPGATVDYANAEGNSDTQHTQVQAMLSRGDCILVVAPNNNDAAAAIVADAQQKNVPVISYDRLITSKNVSYYVSFDNIAVGNLQGSYIAKNYQSYVKTNGTKNIIMIDGAQTDSNALGFHQGALNALQPLFNSKALNKVYDQYTPDWDKDKAEQEMDGALTSVNGKLAIAYVANDTMAHSVIASLKAHNLNGKVLVTGQDASVIGLQDILTGDLSMTVFKPYDKEATAAAQLVAAISKGTSTASLIGGKTVAVPGISGANISSILETPIEIDKSNVSEVVTQGYVTKAELCQGLPVSAGAGICS